MRAFIFDLDGTLVDTVYAHIFAWQRTFAEADMQIEGWWIHRRIGMSGKLFTRAAGRELGRDLSPQEMEMLEKRHGELYNQLLPKRRPLLGAVELLRSLSSDKILYGIATSGNESEIKPSLDVLELNKDVIIVKPEDVAQAKPEPDLFLACQERLGVRPEECYIVGDAVWDLLAARRAGMLAIGLLSGGYGADELNQAGAFRVYRDPLELHRSLDELGVVKNIPG
jgi:HAD superfamily hydrolase (TIGR01509 family)